jgi:hypothetical protein
VNSTDIQRILVVPEAAPAGTTFQVYYCGYEPNTSVQIDLYYVVGRLSNNKSEFRHADSWNVAMNARGWATEALPSSSSDLGVVYYILDHDQALDGETPIRLIR